MMKTTSDKETKLLHQARILLIKINDQFKKVNPQSKKGHKLIRALYKAGDRYIRRYERIKK